MSKKNSATSVPTDSFNDTVEELTPVTPQVENVPVQESNTATPTASSESISAQATQTIRSAGKPMIGIANRKNSSIIINLKKDSLVLSAGAKTGKDYYQSDIMSIDNMTLQQAVLKGICTILR